MNAPNLIAELERFDFTPRQAAIVRINALHAEQMGVEWLRTDKWCNALAALCGAERTFLAAKNFKAELELLVTNKVLFVREAGDALEIAVNHATYLWGAQQKCSREKWLARINALRQLNGLAQLQFAPGQFTGNEPTLLETASAIAQETTGLQSGQRLIARVENETGNALDSRLAVNPASAPRPTCSPDSQSRNEFSHYGNDSHNTRARDLRLKTKASKELKINLKRWDKFTLEEKKDALAELETCRNGDRLRRLLEVILGEDVASGGTHNGDAGKYIIAILGGQRAAVLSALASVVERCFDPAAEPITSIGGYAHRWSVETGVRFGQKSKESFINHG